MAGLSSQPDKRYRLLLPVLLLNFKKKKRNVLCISSWLVTFTSDSQEVALRPNYHMVLIRVQGLLKLSNRLSNGNSVHTYRIIHQSIWLILSTIAGLKYRVSFSLQSQKWVYNHTAGLLHIRQSISLIFVKVSFKPCCVIYKSPHWNLLITPCMPGLN